MDRISIDFISVLGMPPVDFVRLAAELGVGSISLSPRPITSNPHGYADWDLLSDPHLVRETSAALADTGVLVGLGEGFLLREGMDADEMPRLLDLYAELGVPIVNAVNMSPTPDLFTRLAEGASARGMVATLEFMPMMPPGSYAQALAFIEAAGHPVGRVMVDAMHFFRGGSQVEELATGSDRIAYAQLCDVPMPARADNYGLEAREERLAPGSGDLPLAAFVSALPATVALGLEIPEATRAAAGVGPAERLGPAIAAARELLRPAVL